MNRRKFLEALVVLPVVGRVLQAAPALNGSSEYLAVDELACLEPSCTTAEAWLSSPFIDDGRWHHYVFKRSKGVERHYVDGVLVPAMPDVKGFVMANEAQYDGDLPLERMRVHYDAGRPGTIFAKGANGYTPYVDDYGLLTINPPTGRSDRQSP